MRCFIAIDIDEVTRSGIDQLQEVLRRQAGLRESDAKWVLPGNIHLTLKFLGEVPDRDITEVCRIVADVAGEHERFAVEAANVGSFGRPARVVWVGVDDAGNLANLHRAWWTKVGSTMPYLPVCRGPTMLKRRASTTGSRVST